jgi:O-antigen ligase
VLLTGIATTLIVWTGLADPINLPKMFILTISAGWILGSVITTFLYSRDRSLALGHSAIIAFVVCTVLAAFLTDVRYSAFFGEMQRNNGAFSYVALAIMALGAMLSFTSANFIQLRNWVLAVGSVLTVYGLLQTFGHDPFKWVLLYNHVVGTLGNPDFFSGIVGTAAIASVWLILREQDVRFRVAGGVLLLLELFILKRCGSMQGIAAFGMGIALLFIAKFWQLKKGLGIGATTVLGLGVIPVIFGFLNKGPLANHLYRGSIQSRIDYWHAALNMFKAHPWFGVGLDRFGQNYGQYAPQIQVVQGQGTDNAHNVFLQLLATGGLLVILPYLFLIAVIFIAAVGAVKNSLGKERIDTVALLSMWLSLLLVSAISIDNLGVAVWFWILGGALYGVSRGRPEEKQVKKKSGRKTPEDSSYLAPIVALLVSIVVLIVMVPAWRASAMLIQLQRQGLGGTQAQAAVRIDAAANIQSSNIQVKASLANLSLRFGAFDEGLKLIASINRQDPRSVDGNYLGAAAYEGLKNFKAALPYRLRLLQLDPWNRPNMLQLVTDYVALKDMDKAREMSSRLSQLYPNSDAAKAAAVLIKG